MVVEVLLAFLKLEKVKDEASENVEGMFDVGVAPNVVTLKAGWIVIMLKDGFPQAK